MSKLVNKLQLLGKQAKQRISKLWSEERGDTNIIAIILILAIVIALVVLFRNQIGDIFNSIMGSINQDVGDILS